MTAFRNRFTASRGEPPESDSIPLVIPPGNYVDTQAQQQAAAALETQRLADLEAQRLAGLETQRQADLEDQRLAQTQGAADYEAFIASPEGIINQSVTQATVTTAPTVAAAQPAVTTANAGAQAQLEARFKASPYYADTLATEAWNDDSGGAPARSASSVEYAKDGSMVKVVTKVVDPNWSPPNRGDQTPKMIDHVQFFSYDAQPISDNARTTVRGETSYRRIGPSDPKSVQWAMANGETPPDNIYGLWGDLDQEHYGIRTTATQENANFVKESLRQMFPNKTQAEIDQAAYAVWKNKGGDAGAHYNEIELPTGIVRQIAAQLGGVNPDQEAVLKSLEPQFSERAAKITEARNNSDDADNSFATFLSIGLSLFAPGIGQAIGQALGATGATASALGGALMGGATSAITGGDVLRGTLTGGVGGYISGSLAEATAGAGNEYAFSDGASAGTNAVNADIAGAAGVAGTDAVAATDVAGGMEEFGNSTGIPAGAGTPVVFDAAGNVVENAASVAAENSGKSFLTQLGETAEGFANRFGDNFVKQFMKNGAFDTKKFLITLGKPVAMQLANGGSLDLQSIAENMFFSTTGNALGATFAQDLKATGFGQAIGNTASNTIGAAGAGAVVGALSGNDPVNSAIYSGVATGTTGLINNALGTTPGNDSLTNTAGSIVAGAAGNAAGAVASGSNASFGSIFLDGAVGGAINATVDRLFSDTPSGNQIGNSAATGTPNAANATLTGGGVSTDTAINMGDGIDDATAEEIAATGQGGNNTPANAESYQTGNYDQTVATASDTGLINQATETIDDATQAEIDATGQGGGNSPGNVTDYQNDANYDQTVTTTAGGTTTGSTTTTTGGATGGGAVVVGSVGSGTGTGTGSSATSDTFGAPSFGSLFYGYKDLTKDRNVDWTSRKLGG